MPQESRHGEEKSLNLDQWASWLLYERFRGCSPEERQRATALLEGFRDRVVEMAQLRRGDLVLDLGAGTGLLASKAVGEVGQEGLVLAADLSIDALEQIPPPARQGGPGPVLPVGCDGKDIPLRSQSVDALLIRSVLIYVPDKARVLSESFRVLRVGGRLSLFEPINRDRVHNVDLSRLPTQIQAKLAEMEDLQRDPHDPMLNFGAEDLLRMVHAAGFSDVHIETQEVVEEYSDREAIHGFFNRVTAPGEPTMAEVLTRQLGADGMTQVLEAWIERLENRPVRFTTPAVYIAAIKA